jgi:hypothetical protein
MISNGWAEYKDSYPEYSRPFPNYNEDGVAEAAPSPSISVRVSFDCVSVPYSLPS